MGVTSWEGDIVKEESRTAVLTLLDALTFQWHQYILMPVLLSVAMLIKSKEWGRDEGGVTVWRGTHV